MRYIMRRHDQERVFAGSRSVIRAIQDGQVDGSDLLVDEAGNEIRVGVHPEFKNHLIDDDGFHSDPITEMDVDLTPMIDVTFLLLIFFMATTMIVMFKALDAPVSKSDKGKGRRKLPTREQVSGKYLIVVVREDGSISVSDKIAVGLEAMTKLLKKSMKATGKYRLVLESSKKVNLGDMVRVLDAAQQAHADKVLFARKTSKTQ